MMCVRKRELYTQLYTHTHTHIRSLAHLSPPPLAHRLPLFPPSFTYTLAAVTPTPSSLLTLPVDSCCPALSATLTCAVSVAAPARVHTRKSIYTHSPTFGIPATTPVLCGSARVRASERMGERDKREGLDGLWRERKIKKRVGATESNGNG